VPLLSVGINCEQVRSGLLFVADLHGALPSIMGLLEGELAVGACAARILTSDVQGVAVLVISHG